MSGGGGKGGSQTSAQSIPAWLEGPAKANLEKAKLAGEVGYMPYYGPEVAGLSPMQQQGMQRTQDALAAFGMAPQGSQYQSYLPETTTMGGVTGYSSGNLFDQAVAELALRNPEQAARYASAMAPAPAAQQPSAQDMYGRDYINAQDLFDNPMTLFAGAGDGQRMRGANGKPMPTWADYFEQEAQRAQGKV